MSFGSFLRGIAAQVNPFDNGQTYGTFNPAKKKDDSQSQFSPTPTPPPAPSQPQISTQSPQNLFASLSNNLRLPGSPQNNVSVAPNNNNYASPTLPQPGTVIQPNVTGVRMIRNGQNGTMATNKVTGQQNFVPDASTPPKNPSFWDHVMNGAKTAAGVVANIPEVGLAAARTGTGLIEGLTQLPHLVTALAATGTQKLNQALPNNFTHALNTGAQAANTGVNDVTKVVDKPLNFVNRGLDTAANAYANNVPVAAGGSQVYRSTQIPLNVLAALLTLGGSTAAEAGQAGKIGEGGNVVSRFLNKPLTSNPDNIIAKTGQIVSNKAAPVVNAVNAPFSSAKNAIMSRLNNSRNVSQISKDIVDAGEAGNVTQIPVTQSRPVNVTQVPGEPTTVPVTNNTPTGKPIVEIGGDTPGKVNIPTPSEVAAQKAKSAFDNQPTARPDQNIEGVTPTNTGNTGGFTRAEIQTEQKALDEALANGELNKTAHAAASKELKSLTAVDSAPKGSKITVKQVDSIPVSPKDVVVPTDLPETPGKVRVTTQNAPANAEAAAVAAKPVVAPPAKLPAETQAILDNPKQYNKRQVAAARNQFRLAKKMAKTQEDTAAVTEQLHNVKPTSDKGFVPTGEFRKGAQGNVTESASKTLEAAQGAHDTTNLSAQDVLAQVKDEINKNGIVSPETTRNLKAIRDSGRFTRTSPEFKAINEEYKNAISHHARALSMTDRTARTSATGDQLANRFTSKLLSSVEDSSKISEADIQQVTQAENAFTEARDAANALGEQFKASGNPRTFESWKKAQKQAETLDRRAKITEYLVSKRALGGNKNMDAVKAIQDAEKKAGVYSMDAIDSNMLSGTGTMVRNYINTLFPRVENKLFGRASTLAVRKLAPVGGSSGRGARIGSEIGKDMFKADMAARKEAGVGFIRRTVTAGNMIGEKNIEATAYSKAFDHYKQLLKQDGYKGTELNNRAEFNVHTDPDGLVSQYQRDTLQANALASNTNNKKIENWLSDTIQKKMADLGFGHTGQQIGRFGTKAFTRVGLGFPTVIARSLVEGFKRATLGIPEAGLSTFTFLKSGNTQQYAEGLAKAMQHAGSGGSLFLLGHELGKLGVITGAYPSDPTERDKWKTEGKQPNSIKIAGQTFNIPGYLGGFALPLMIGATTATGNIQDAATLKNAWQTVLDASPVDNIQSTLSIFTGGASEAKVKNAVTSLVRSMTPAGSFLAQLAKLTDHIQNDTTTKDVLHNILDSIAGGIPGLNNKVNTIPKLDSYGNELHNPNPIATILGAQGSDQLAGIKDVQQAQSVSDSAFNDMKQYGVLNDKNLMQLVDPKLAKQITDGRPLTPEQLKKVQESVTKGISPTEDSNWRQSGNYTTDKAALQVKLQLLNADPTAKPSEKQAIQTQITRDDILNNNSIPYDALKQYQSTSVADWRSMGDAKSDNYDPETYQKLWAIDQLMAKGGASYHTNDPSQQKYSTAKKAGSGNYNPNFGQLKANNFAPQVQKYETIGAKSGIIPVIGRSRMNIVHNIGEVRVK